MPTRRGLTCGPVFSRRLVGVRLLAASPSLRNETPSPCECGKRCPSVPALLPSLTTLIISSRDRCFDRAWNEAARGGLGTSMKHRINAEFVSENTTLKHCCKDGGSCGQGRRSKPSHRARVDGIARAHRRAWEYVVRTNRPGIVFEDDVDFVGSPGDTAYAIDRCLSAAATSPSACGIAYLGVGFDSWLLAHAYLVTPLGATHLLRITKELCNSRGIDYAMEALCKERKRINCTLPPRGLSRPGSQGWGIFLQNTKAVPPFNSLINGARGRTVASNYTAERAEAFHRC